MSYLIVGLGNPGEKYETTRHNVGRMVLDHIREKNDFPEWRRDGALNALVSEGVIAGENVMLLEPETFMNNSGMSVKQLIRSSDEAARCIVVHDELDLALGSLKISFNRGDAGNNGVASIIEELKTKAFIRLRVGVSPKTLFGKVKRPRGEGAVNAFVLKPFTASESKKITGIAQQSEEMIRAIVGEGKEVAMNIYNR